MPNDSITLTPAATDGRRRRGRKDAEQQQQRDFDRGRHDREDDAEAEMEARVGDAPLDRPPVAQPKERRRERGADVHARHPADEHVLPGHRLASIEARHRVLGDVEQPGDRPGEPESRDQPDLLTHARRHHRFILPWVALEPGQPFDEAACRDDQRTRSPRVSASSACRRDSPSKTACRSSPPPRQDRPHATKRHTIPKGRRR